MADDKNKLTAKSLETINAALLKQAEFYKTIGESKKAAGIEDDMAANRQKVLNELYLQEVQSKSKTSKKYKEITSSIDKLQAQQKEYNDKLKEENDLLDKGVKNRRLAVDIGKTLLDQLKVGWTYLQAQDKIIKSTILNLGMSGVKADMMRTSFEDSANFVTRLGGSLEDIQTIMQGYAEETGRARALSADMVKDITLIGKGTGLGVEQAMKLGAQFELMGFDAKTTMDYVQGVVDTSERMGVNTTKVLKNISDNFKKLNTYNFQQGVKGFAQMAEYAEKFKIDIGDALNAADTARTLEGAIDMVAKLQVMGGEFAKMDMFETLYFARNDPAKLQAKIADMTKGLVTLRKTSDGTFEKFISPADRDRLAQAGKALGIDAAKMTEMSERAFDIQKMSQQLEGIGLSDKQKEIVEGAAIFNKENGKFEVQLAGKMRDISTLTKDQADSFVKEKKSLEERAKQAMTFDDTFKATIETLKASLLPLLKQVNWLLDHTIKPIADLASKGWGVAGAATALIGAAVAWKLVTNKLGNVVDKWVEGQGGKGASGFFGRTKGGGGGAAGGKFFTKAGNIKKGAPELAKAQGLKNLGTGAGIGAAAVGMGAGVALAAEGIAKLADSMSKLTKDQAENLKSIAMTLAITFPLAAIGIAAVAGVAAPAAVPLLALGAALLMIGGAVGIAAAGIGFMGVGLGDMFKNIKGAGDDFLKVAQGVGMMAMSFASVGVTLPAAIGLAFAIGRISKNAESLVKVGDAFANIKAVMSGSKDDFVAVQNAVESISKMNTKGGGMLADLATLLKTPLKVEFADGGKVALNNDVTLNLDGEKFMQRVYREVIAIERREALKNGQAAH